MDVYAGGVVLAEVVRSGFTEGLHRGSVAVLDARGVLRHSAGDVAAPILPRSSNKPMQAVGMLRHGLRPRESADLALICASHSGEPFHIDRVRALLSAAGLDESALECPADLPLHDESRAAVLRAGGGPERVLMNCSGKHAGMLATCVANGWEPRGYLDPGHPLQVAVAEVTAELVREPIAASAVDGCGAPAFAFSLTAMAGTFLRLVQAEAGTHERSVVDAMRAHPELVGGTGRDDTELMSGVPGLLSKGGAEGVVVTAVPGVGAVAIKIDDGGMRARMPVLVSALRRLGVQAPVLDEWAEFALLAGGDRVRVGEVRAVW